MAKKSPSADAPSPKPVESTTTSPKPLCASTTMQLGKLLRVRVLTQLAFENRVFVFREPLVVEAEGEASGLWVHTCRELGILSYGMTEDNSRDEFATEFALTYDGLANEPDSMLTVDAQRLALMKQRGHVQDQPEKGVSGKKKKSR